MPEYIYACPNKDHPRVSVVHGMLQSVEILCNVCAQTMHRVPQAQRINWGGIREEIHPKVKQFIEDAPRRREHYEEVHRA